MKLLNTGLFILLLFQPSQQVLADIEVNISLCASISEDPTRLACYDTLVNSFQTQSSQWRISSTPSFLNNTDNITLSLLSSQTIKSRTQTVRPVLELRCNDKNSTLKLNWSVYLGKNRTEATTKLGQLEAITQFWSIGKDNRTISHIGKTDELIRQLKTQPSLTMQITPYNAKAITATFNTNGLAEVIQQTMINCLW
jgi:type VI secretion system protein VasI